MSDTENQEAADNQPQEEEEEESGSRPRARPGRKKGQKVKKANIQNLNLYIFKVLKQVHPDMGLSKKSMMVLNSFMLDVFDRLATEAANAVKYTNKNTMDARAIECAARLCLPGELAKHAQKEANKALKQFMSHKKKKGQ